MATLTPDAIKQFRGEKDISQRDFATRAGVAQSSLSRFENGEANLSDENEAKVLEYMTRNTKDKSATPVTHEDTPIENIIDDSLVGSTSNQVIDLLIEGVGSTVDEHVQNVRIPATALFSQDLTFSEMGTIINSAEAHLASAVKSTVRDLLESLKNNS